MKYKLSDLVEIKYGKNYKKLKSGSIPVYGSGGIMKYVNDYLYNGKSVLIPRKGSLNNVFYVTGKFWTVDTLFWTKVNSNIVVPKYLYYCLKKINLSSLNVGSAVPSLTVKVLNNINIDIPSLEYQKKIIEKMSKLETKIEINNKINDNLFEIANVIFDDKFPKINNADVPISNYFLPKRGKNLLKRNVIEGSVPVIAGGLKPAAYHNKSNTLSPVITISASGANAGYVKIWFENVWSSDSSFIDSSITNNIYFWYILLKKRQQDIFDSQTGSAQPHIYPKHIGDLLIGNISEIKVNAFNQKISPLFSKIGLINKENTKLINIKNQLLKKYFD
ncbi:restriction endonuclease subunit S [Lactobacillus sp. ESL0681]|uniref:restriction endonuclease subunit S n=1 Tax=Lactobacillus sp. ESL0681 TaxID=2983211 RepID=UPI0023F7FCC9|nr:restriction endonuclease subunit S [Lactobacillus sp. ESL0681]WEV40699.1 restriction endonuclease subunit S [Lactobacillus sp. ESL0681]